MKLSQKGLDLICSFEGYLTKQKDGSCKAYQCPAKVWTCGWGCTEGVTPNTHWTREEALERYHAELAKFEKAVDRLVKVPLNQNQYDALVSFAYNCGEGALAKSGLLKKVNKGDVAGACREFPKWNKGGGRVLAGLVNRRAKEASLYARPVAVADQPEETPVEPMPQAVDAPAKDFSKPMMLGMGGATAIPAAPSLDSFTGWKSFGDTAHDLFTWATASPFLVGAVAVTIGSIWFGPMLLSKFRGTS